MTGGEQEPAPPELNDVRSHVAAQRAAAEAMRGRERPVRSGELNPGGGEYLETLTACPCRTGGQVGDGRDHTMTTILVPLDGSELAEAAVPVARWLAQGLHAEVVPVSVAIAPETSEQTADESADAERMLRRATSELPGVPVRRRIEATNDSVAGILRAAREERPGLIVMSTHGRTGLSELAQGSVARDIVRAGIAPVTLVQATDRR